MARVDPARAKGVTANPLAEPFTGLLFVGDDAPPDFVGIVPGTPEVDDAVGVGAATPRMTNDSVEYGPTRI